MFMYDINLCPSIIDRRETDDVNLSLKSEKVKKVTCSVLSSSCEWKLGLLRRGRLIFLLH